MKIYYVANARMPSEKAHGIQIAKMCEAFVDAGVDLTLVVSNRGAGTLKEFYGLTRTILLHRLPVLDLQFLGPIGYRLTAFQFTWGALFYLWRKVLRGEQFAVYTIDMDEFSFTPLSWLARPLFAEMHNIKKPGFLTRHFFKRARIIATNTLIADRLTKDFKLPSNHICIEPNGVDEAILQTNLSPQEARAKLGLPLKDSFALYVGRFYPWKGLGILADAASESSLPIRVVGGTREEYESVANKSGGRLEFFGVRAVDEIPIWLAAADVLIVLGTKHNEDSYRHTSPMKVFEYLAARRATVISKTPAMESIVRGGIAFWYEPDNAHSLAQAIQQAHTSAQAQAQIQAGRTFAAEHTWGTRAKRILAFMAHISA